HILDLRKGAAPLPDFKIMVLGNGRIGKTQICRRLLGESYIQDADSTHGITVTTTSLAAHAGTEEAGDVLAHLWDFGGQDIYHGTHTLFMRSRAVFFVVWTPESEDRTEHQHQGIRFRNHRLDYWLEMVRQVGGPGSPVLLIQTRCDSVEDEVRHPKAPDALLDNFGFCKILHYSARENRGRAALDEAIQEAIGWTRKHQGYAKIGIVRLKVRRRLEKLREEDALLPPPDRKYRVLKKSFFELICEEEGGVSSADHFLAYLHECGVLFHLPGIFDNAIILDQEWALDAIYTVFNREKCWRHLRQTRGRFTRALLSTLVWQNYDSDQQAIFLDMMTSAGICFVHRKSDANAETETQYVAPDLLPDLAEVQEELAAYWQDEPWEEEIIDLPFEYPGLVRNIIARVGHLAGMNAVYWRGGVCGFELRTRSAVRIDTLPSSGAGSYELSVSIRTQRGRAMELLGDAVRWVKEEARKMGCKAFDEEGKERSVSGGERHPDGLCEGETEERIKGGSGQPEFGMPPRQKEINYCVSYAWTKESSGFVDQLCDDASLRGIEVIRDKTHLGLGERISRFMSNLAKGDRVFVILSDKFLKSAACMFELFEVWRQCRHEDEEFLKKVRIYMLPELKIGTIVDRIEVAAHWKQQYEEIGSLIKKHGAEVIGGDDLRAFKRMQEFALHVGDILGLVMDTLQPRTLEALEEFAFEDDNAQSQ
ncbi:MAG: COR domain-containing protein, partial [Chthoniobacterales bacterium]